MTQGQFEAVLQLVKRDITKNTTNWRKPISARERLAVCLRFLATGDSYKSIGFSFRIGEPTVRIFVSETCTAIWKNLQLIYMAEPTEEDWITIAYGFQDRWNFPNCIGALDGKRVVMKASPKSGSLYYNYKGSFSIVLMALVDYKYCFVAIDVGSYGRNSDGGIFSASTLGRALENGTLNVPDDKPLPNYPEIGSMPHVIVDDEAFPLKTNLLRPYPGRDLDDAKRIFNYRLSRARRIVENAFGILASRWRIYQRRIQLSATNTDHVIKATCVLHNFLQITSPRSEQHELNREETVNTDLLEQLRVGGNRGSKEANQVRDSYKNYFMSEVGEVRWQRTACFGIQDD